MERHELGDGAESKLGRRSQRIVCGGCHARRNSLGCRNSLSLSPAAHADRAKAALSSQLRLTRRRPTQTIPACCSDRRPRRTVVTGAMRRKKSIASIVPKVLYLNLCLHDNAASLT